MSRLEKAIYEIHGISRMAEQNGWMNRLHPLVKLIVTFAYILIIVSFDNYNINGLTGMAVYPVVLFILADISFGMALRRLRVVLPLVCLIGIVNPFIDKQTVLAIAGIEVTGGILSMCTLAFKGVLTVFAVYILIATTTIEDICYAMRLLHLPKIFVTLIMLIYRYIVLLLEEADRITKAYLLRAPGQKGINYKAWGSMIGQLVLRSMDRAVDVYASMSLRGYNGEFVHKGNNVRVCDLIYAVGWVTVFIIFRQTPVLEMIGSIFGMEAI